MEYYGRIVTNQQAIELQGTFIDSDTFYFLFLSEQDEQDVSNTEYSYLLNIPLSPYTPPPLPPIE
jgi:hypothetical protein